MQANNTEVKPIFPESEEAAKFVTGISGWVDRDGQFWGGNEKIARFSGSTHKHCKCGAVIPKNSYCKDCHRKKYLERYKNAKKIEWDHKTPLYSQAYDKYLFDTDDLVDFMCESEATDTEELELFICEPQQLSYVDTDHWYDDLPEDGELPDNVQAAVDALNKAIDEAGTVSWFPGDVAAIVNALLPRQTLLQPADEHRDKINLGGRNGSRFERGAEPPINK